MIWESAPWKEQLLRDAGRITRLRKIPIGVEGNERQSVTCERIVFIAAYTMRKLWESGKLSTAWNDGKLECRRYPIKGRVPDTLNWHRIDEHYDLTAPALARLKPEEFCDRIIHSFIFLLAEDEDGFLDGVFFTSDRMRKHCLWFIKVDELVKLMRSTGRDYPSKGHWLRDSEGQLVTWAGHGEPPAGWLESAARKQRPR